MNSFLVSRSARSQSWLCSSTVSLTYCNGTYACLIFFLVSISSHANEQIKDCQVVESRNATSSQETCVVKLHKFILYLFFSENNKFKNVWSDTLSRMKCQEPTLFKKTAIGDRESWVFKRLGGSEKARKIRTFELPTSGGNKSWGGFNKKSGYQVQCTWAYSSGISSAFLNHCKTVWHCQSHNVTWEHCVTKRRQEPESYATFWVWECRSFYSLCCYSL